MDELTDLRNTVNKKIISEDENVGKTLDFDSK